MRVLWRVLLALGLMLAVEGRALAFVTIDVDLSSQTMRVHSTDGENYVWPISSGREGHATPRGVFQPQRLYAMVHSAKYNNAPMPHSIFFHGQYAIHGTNAVGALGSPASHGCIRLSPAHAAALFAMVQAQGAQISIGGSAQGSEVAHARRHHADSALAFAPVHHPRTLGQWAKNPVAR
ncbi:L,D-transpeptidase-like protein [Roseiarcus fermentans]|uniref:L,D-transpeptidase-like protein n=1 Tax=Roseiarcus fermentans TaxID=1473586 RepID=A0A366EEG9_9HYPH|nr:L,D-transpeptidase [Roseiarcus fermentans]RBP00797.1 L,D-transpeptidase-like protein [Roseiarcus fermentans]